MRVQVEIRIKSFVRFLLKSYSYTGVTKTVTVTPEDGKANNQVIKLLAKELKIPKSKISIIKGVKSRNKTIAIED